MDTDNTATDVDGQEPKAEVGQEPDSGQQAKVYDETYVRELRGEAASYRRELAEAKKALQQIEDSKKSDLEKAIEKATEAERRAAAAEMTLLRRSIADEVGLPPALAARLAGDREDAKSLLETIGSTKPKGVDLDAGPKGDPVKPPSLDEQIAEAQRKGDTRAVITLQNRKLAELRST